MARARRRREPRAHARPERAAGALPAPQPPQGRRPRRIPRRSRFRSPRGARRGAHSRRLAATRPRLAAKPRVAARGPLRRGGGRRAYPRPLRRARRQGHPARRKRGRRGAARGPGAGAGGDRVAARRGERPCRLRRRARASVRPRRLRSSPRRRAVLRARDARLSPRPALASRAAPRAPAGAAARRGRTRPPRRGNHVRRLHDEPGGERGRRRRARSRARRPRRRLAALPASEPPGVPAHAAAPPRHERLLRRPCRRPYD